MRRLVILFCISLITLKGFCALQIEVGTQNEEVVGVEKVEEQKTDEEQVDKENIEEEKVEGEETEEEEANEEKLEEQKVEEEKKDSALIFKKYLGLINTLVRERDSLRSVATPGTPNAYYYQILTLPALYNSPLHQMMGQTDTSCADPQMQRLFASRKALSELYTQAPWLITQTENDIRSQASIRSDVNEKLQNSDKLADKVVDSKLTPDMNDPIEVITRRPNFWHISGNTSLQFVQNYFTDNWRWGGETNFTGNFDLTLRANYNDQRKFNWNNTVNIQLGFQTTSSDKNRTFRPSSNLLRYTTDAGYKAWKTLYYSLQVILQTQIAPNYHSNSDKLHSKILSPLESTIAPGMKWEFAFGKKKQFSGRVNVAPLAMKSLFVYDDELVTNFGLPKDTNSKHTFGPNVTMNTNWQVCKQISWSTRVYWMSNFEYNILEWENTINFSVTKYITAQMYLYPRFDNSSERFRDISRFNTYFMFKEYLSLGLKYSF